MLHAWKRVRGAFAAIIAIAAIAEPASAQSLDDTDPPRTISATAIAGSTWIARQDSFLRQDRYFQVPAHIPEIAGLLEGEWSGIAWRVRGEREMPSGSTNTSHGKLTLAQAYKNFTSTDQSTTLSIGKRNYALDQTFVGQPLAFLQKSTDLGDPNDSQGKAEGVPMIAISWAGSQASLVAIYSDDTHSQRDGYNSGIRQEIVKVGYEFAQSSAALLLRKATGESVGWGITASSSIGENLTLYGSYYRSKGTLRPILGALVGAQPDSTPLPAWGSFRADDGVTYPRYTLGATITPSGWPQIQLEYIADTRGLDDRQFAHLMQLIDPDQAPNTANGALALRRAMIASGMPSGNLRQHYVAMNIVHTGETLTAAAGIYQCLDDSSRLWYASLNRKWDRHWSTVASISLPQGNPHSERGLSLTGAVLSLHVLRSF